MILRHRRDNTRKKELPLVPLRELVVFPHMVTPFFAGRDKSIRALEEAMGSGRAVMLVCQRRETEEPEKEDLYDAGTIARIVQMLKLPDGTVRVLVEGQERANLLKVTGRDSLKATVSVIPDAEEPSPAAVNLMKSLRLAFKTYASGHKKISQETLESAERAEFPDKLVDIVAANVNLEPEEKIGILGQDDPVVRLESLLVLIESANEIAGIQNRIHGQVKKRLEQGQKEYYLNEQLKEIHRELGRDDEDPTGAKELEKRIEAKEMPEEAKEKGKKEVGRLSKLGPMSPEAGVLRTYLEWMCDLPWRETTRDNTDIDRAAVILDEDHYDLKKAKERILDFIAVTQLNRTMKGPILCFVGPPGTGKTSLGKSVARALGRKFVRISLGGVKDEAEIRGHRKTYVGALPGKIVQSMKKAGTMNPVFLLDEIDKINSDFRGDPASALLEVLDPEQNNTFTDHYLEVPYDLSNVLFITTANSIHTIPYPLRDRMEIIEISGYTDYEKQNIASKFIVPKQLKENGLDWAEIVLEKKTLLEIIRNYTMESGVRELERQIATIIRKVARDAVKQGYTRDLTDEQRVEKGVFKARITPKSLKDYLGKRKHLENKVHNEVRPGLAYGLAWTEVGGTLLPVEVALLDGKGELILTGSLGDVMKESARTALSFIQAHYRAFGLERERVMNANIHIHVPEGAIPKDGPSAGITLTAAILSALKGVSLKTGYAMTGEITLTGRLLPVGGIKEKLLAAHRNSIKTVLMPEENRKDIEDLPKEVVSTMNFFFTDTVKDALLELFP
ncbi:MAG: endopeptidase La [Spirochaetia bacterium]